MVKKKKVGKLPQKATTVGVYKQVIKLADSL